MYNVFSLLFICIFYVFEVFSIESLDTFVPSVCTRCHVDLSLLSKECTHRLDLPLEEGEGTLVLLVTLTASAAVSISDLSVNMLNDPHERREIMHRYVSTLLFLYILRALKE